MGTGVLTLEYSEGRRKLPNSTPKTISPLPCGVTRLVFVAALGGQRQVLAHRLRQLQVAARPGIVRLAQLQDTRRCRKRRTSPTYRPGNSSPAG